MTGGCRMRSILVNPWNWRPSWTPSFGDDDLWPLSWPEAPCRAASMWALFLPYLGHLRYLIWTTIMYKVFKITEVDLIWCDIPWTMKYVATIVSKAHQRLGFIRRNLRGSTYKCRETAFIALTRSQLEYCSSISDPILNKDSDSIEKVQRKAARWARGQYGSISVTQLLAPGNPTLWRGVPVASMQKSFGWSGRDWKPLKKLPIPCKFCTYRFIRYSSTCYGKVRIYPLMANIRNPDFFASPVGNAAWFVEVRPCCLNRDLLSGPQGN